MVQLHKKFNDSQVKQLMQRYLNKELRREYLQDILGMGKTRFFALLNQYKKDPVNFSIQYCRSAPTRKISPDIEKNILKELAEEKKLIQDKATTIKCYNYSHVREILQDDYKQHVSLSTIINRAKTNRFYINKPKRKSHDKEVITNHAGEMIQHDSSHHKFSPYADKKWYLITSLDDYSRFMLYADLIEIETTWAHICATEYVFLNYGLPLLYYVDSHSIFRFVQKRDSFWRNHYKLTDDVDTQWKQVLNDCNVKVTHALSPQARGKIERPYRWIQDRLTRICARKNISDIKPARQELRKLIHKYNYTWIHSTTGDIPNIRFQRALKEKQSLFREFSIKPPFKSTQDIFCIRIDRTIDGYRRISLDNIKFKPKNAKCYESVTLRISPIDKIAAEVRFWCNDELIDIQRAKIKDLKSVHF
jgi:hypothetical protein